MFILFHIVEISEIVRYLNQFGYLRYLLQISELFELHGRLSVS